MNGIIYYFTGTYNTLKIVELYIDYFKERSIDLEKCEIKRIMETPKDLNYDYIGLAYPIHAFNSPLLVEEFARKLPIVDEKPFFIISTCGEPLKLNNSASLKIEKILKKKGYHLTNEYHYLMPYNIMFRHSDDMAYKMYETNKKLVRMDAKEIINRESHLYKRGIVPTVVKTVLKIEEPAMRANGILFKVDYDKCIKCMKCLNNCSASNISYEDDKFVFHNHCNMCTRCAFSCPTNAISIGLLKHWKVNGAYSFSKDDHKNHEKDHYLKKTYDKYYKYVDKKIDNE